MVEEKPIAFDFAVFNTEENDFKLLIHELSRTLLLEKKPVSYKPKQIKSELSNKLVKDDWIPKLKIFENNNSYIQFTKNKIGLSVQMGHFGQSYVDILKFELAFTKKKINSAVMVLLDKDLAKKGNHANFQDCYQNLEEFKKFLNCPMLLIKLI